MLGHGNAVSQKTFSLCWPVSIVNVASHSKAVLLWQTLDFGHTYIHVLVSELGSECVHVCVQECAHSIYCLYC